ncbi:hypothetical protein QFZ55_004167 [Streptomyces luteogriseus]|nr:hypothetical protein [Streptomyces luteogriseus]
MSWYGVDVMTASVKGARLWITRSAISGVGHSGVKTAATRLPEHRNVGRGEDAAPEHRDVPGVRFAEEPEELREGRHVRAGQHGEPDAVGVFLDRGVDDLAWGLVEPGADGLDPRVPQGAGDDLGASVMPVEAGLGDHATDRCVHRPG